MIIAFLTIFALLYYIMKLQYGFWKRRGVIGPNPTPPFGNQGKVFFMKISLGELYTEIYRKYPNERVVGIFRTFFPALLVRDPELIKDITVKCFSSFHDNDIYLDKKTDPIVGRNPFVLKGEEWKTVRSQLTPGFTSGKMKWIYPLLEDMSRRMVDFVGKQPTAINGEGYEGKELSVRFTLNNVASCAFGLEGKCFEEDNNSFRKLAKDFFNPESWSILVFSVMAIFPPISKIVPVRIVPKHVEKKLTEIVKQTVKYREENKIERNDFIQILSRLKTTCTEYEFTDEDVTAHAAGFFGDGFETSSMVMSFVLYQLANNPREQQNLREEIQNAFDEHNQMLPYETLQSLAYLDAVFNETLRIQPPALSLQRLCTKPYTFSNGENDVTIAIGTPIIIPLHAIQNDPQYFEDPDTFKPERFISPNKENINKGTFIPFGQGPRECLGQRFGILQVKAGVAHLIKNYEIRVNKKTKQPLKYDPTNILLTPIGGLWLNFKKV